MKEGGDGILREDVISYLLLHERELLSDVLLLYIQNQNLIIQHKYIFKGVTIFVCNFFFPN